MNVQPTTFRKKRQKYGGLMLAEAAACSSVILSPQSSSTSLNTGRSRRMSLILLS